MQDRGYDVRGGGIMDTILQDTRYGVRLLLTHRGFSVVAILTLAVGIGASTALFSVIDAALLRPLPYAHPEQLVDIMVRKAQHGESRRYDPSIADVRAWRGHWPVLAHVGAGRLTGFLPLIVDAGAPERLTVGEASEDFLEVYGVTPLLGRGIRIEDTREGAPLVALLGHAYWQTRFGGSPDVLGRVIRIAGMPATIVGVLPPGFYRETSVWQPTQIPASRTSRRGSGTSVVGRLRPGVTIVQAERALTDLSMGIAPDPGQAMEARVELTSMYDDETSGASRAIAPLAGAVSLILLIACVNVAGLLLARGTIRGPELAIRASIGAGRARLVRQLLTESLILSSAGGLVGVMLAWASLDALVAIIPMSLPPNSPATLNLRVLGFAAAVSVLSSVVCGIVPAIRISGARMGTQLAVAGRRHGSALSRRGGQLLIAGEVALAVVLLAGAGLMIRSFARLTGVDLGFDPRTVLTMEVEPLDPAPAVLAQYYPALLDAIRTLPGLAAAGAVDYFPLYDASAVGFAKGAGKTNVSKSQILPGYFESLGLPVKMGRLPTDSDRTGAERVVLINEEAARVLFPGSTPVGRFLEMLGDEPRRIIGVVGNVRRGGTEKAPRPGVYLLFGQAPPHPMRIVLRPRSSAVLSGDRLRKMAEAVGPKVLVGRIWSGTDRLGETVVKPRRRAQLLGLLGGLGMLLTLVGIFSMTAYAVARRTREIGVRMAFGAGPTDVVLAMVRDAAWPVFIGLSAGMAGAYFATRVIASFLFDTTPHDPATFAAVAVLMGGAALAAAWVPARRAAQVDPVIALRAE
jgi:predicted permease